MASATCWRPTQTPTTSTGSCDRERGRALAPRSATSDLALLLLTLRDPGPLPAFAAQRLGEEAEEAVARLVLDGVLELEQDGRFVSGRAGSADPTEAAGRGDAVACSRLPRFDTPSRSAASPRRF